MTEPSHEAAPRWRQVRNEFSSIEVAVSPEGEPSMLIITSMITGRSIALDALELEALTLLSHRSFDALVLATVQAEHDLQSGDEPQPPSSGVT